MKKMKKAVALILALILVCSTLAACGKDKLVGVWSYSDEYYNSYIMAINEDGTGSINGQYFNWYTEDNILCVSNDFDDVEKAVYRIEGNTLYLYADGETLVLHRQK